MTFAINPCQIFVQSITDILLPWDFYTVPQTSLKNSTSASSYKWLERLNNFLQITEILNNFLTLTKEK